MLRLMNYSDTDDSCDNDSDNVAEKITASDVKNTSNSHSKTTNCKPAGTSGNETGDHQRKVWTNCLLPSAAETKKSEERNYEVLTDADKIIVEANVFSETGSTYPKMPSSVTSDGSVNTLDTGNWNAVDPCNSGDQSSIVCIEQNLDSKKQQQVCIATGIWGFLQCSSTICIRKFSPKIKTLLSPGLIAT